MVLMKSDRLVPAALITLTLVPVGAGAVRLAGLAGGAEITPDNARFFASPLPAVLHIVGATLFCIMGAFQFAPALRRGNPGWHRRGGWLLIASGLVATLSGLWMTQFYSRAWNDGDLLYGLRLTFGWAMAVSIVLGFVAIKRRDVVRHRAWIMRAYAIGMGAGTQAIIHLPWFLVAGVPGELARGLLMGAG
ncbi:DUF2306 domain-containing protein [Microvirga sp. BT688]|uniref:DUF2306 domain-containing protein n=1 Tax=Microvirga sp. TaxID=1873136 RepID=UPI0016888B2C|nr:DUF2306 domain-containing protein [Microvirga sp.]MBD2749634.1 DUF2306 domain-containing protein [Microvirga sp.]